MNQCKKENCLNPQLVTKYGVLGYCHSHSCIFAFNGCELECVSDKIRSCKLHQCFRCPEPVDFEYLRNYGLPTCKKCHDAFIKKQQFRFFIGSLVVVGLIIGYNFYF